MQPWLIAAGWLLAVASAAILTPVAGAAAFRVGLVDAPDGWRKRHLRAVPNVGGVAIAAAFALAWTFVAAAGSLLGMPIAAQPASLWIGAIVILLAGLFDDVFGLRCNYKLLMQVAAAYLLIHAGFRIDVTFLPFLGADPYVAALYSLPLTVLWIVGIINAVNLLDGLDGLAGGVALIVVSTLTAACAFRGEFSMLLPALILTGVLIGFLAHNAHPATIFMGDSGSMLIGYLLAALTLGGFGGAAAPDELLVGAVALGLPFVDMAVAVARRLADRRPIFDSDHDHIHHRLLSRYGHQRAVFTLYGVSLVFGILAALMAAIDLELWIFPLAALAVGSRMFLTNLGYPALASVVRQIVHVGPEAARIVDLHTPLADPPVEERAA